jgi:hypothetical protein
MIVYAAKTELKPVLKTARTIVVYPHRAAARHIICMQECGTNGD